MIQLHNYLCFMLLANLSKSCSAFVPCVLLSFLVCGVDCVKRERL